MSMRPPPCTSDRLYTVDLEDLDDNLYEIVLPGRSHGHAHQAAQALLALTGPKAFRRLDLMDGPAPDLTTAYKEASPSLLPVLFEAYDLIADARAALTAETDLFAVIEYQIDQARAHVRPCPEALRNYLTQKALVRLPLNVVRAAAIRRSPANAFQTASHLPRETVSMARAFSQAMARDAEDIAGLNAKVRAEHILSRKTISSIARNRISQIRAEVKDAFKPHFRMLRDVRSDHVSPPPHHPQPLGTLTRSISHKAAVKSHQSALRLRVAPVLQEKRAALKRADELHNQFQRTGRALANLNLPDLQRQWRELASSRMRQVHGPQAPAPPPRPMPGFFERLATRAVELRRQTPAPEQNRTPDPE